jgi:hypothetical protein
MFNLNRPALRVVAAVVALIVATALWAGLFTLREVRRGGEFDAVRFELSTLANKWLFALGAPLRSDPAADAAIVAYFERRDRGDSEGQRLENVVEAAIEGRLDAMLREFLVGGRFAFRGPFAVWPPVDIELGRSPRVLLTSPRARIERLESTLLDAELTLERAVALEVAAEAGDPTLSALAQSTGGIAFYPSVVRDDRSFATTVETAAHEWVHHYMSFYPLGVGLPSGDRRVISETVADIAGDELGAAILDRFGDPTNSRRLSEGAQEFVSTRLRDLRIEVDVMLADGQIEAAERRMDEVRGQLAAAGFTIRRINQAYFAWIGTYAARADAIDELGAELRELRERSTSLADFMQRVRGATTRDDVARLLAESD